MAEMSANLLELARKKFVSCALSNAEENLFRAAQDGPSVVEGHDIEGRGDPANAAGWDAASAVRAECIAWLCTSPEASPLVMHRGLCLRCIRIEGDLDLDYAEIKFPLLARKCAFTGRILLRYARLELLFFEACYTKDVEAYGARIASDFFLGNGSTPEGETDQHASCRVEGEVNLFGATIGGSLDCSGAHFSNPTKIALNANSAQIEGHVFLTGGFKAEGEVTLVAARIEGNLECDGADFVGSKSGALSPNSARIGGNVYLAEGFRTVGEVNLGQATIGGLLEIRNVRDPDELTLNLHSVKVATFLDDKESWPQHGKLMLDGFQYERLHQKAPVNYESRKDWLSRQSRLTFLPQPYEKLAAVLREMGHERDARCVMIEKNRERGRFTSFPRPAWWWYKGFGRLIGYGYQPARAFWLSLAMIVLGTFLFDYGYCRGLISPTNESAYAEKSSAQFGGVNQKGKIADDYPVFSPFVYSLESFTPLLELDQNANWRPNANHGDKWGVWIWEANAGGWLRRYLWFHIIAGWVLTTLWVGAITGLVKS